MKKQQSSFTQEVLKIFNARMVRFSINQSELAGAIGVSQSQLSKILRGARPMDLDVFAGICDALNLSIARVADEAERIVNDLLYREQRIPAAERRLIQDSAKLEKPINLERYHQTYYNHNRAVPMTANPQSLADDMFDRGYPSQPHYITSGRLDDLDPYHGSPSLSEEEKKQIVLDKIASGDMSLAASRDPNKYLEMEHGADDAA